MARVRGRVRVVRLVGCRTYGMSDLWEHNLRMFADIIITFAQLLYSDTIFVYHHCLSHVMVNLEIHVLTFLHVSHLLVSMYS